MSGNIGPHTTGEVIIGIRGGSEAFHAFAYNQGETFVRGEQVLVIEYVPPRNVYVTKL